MTEKGYRIEARDETFVVHEILVKVFTTPWAWVCANIHGDVAGRVLTSLPNSSLTRDEWNLLKQAVDEAFDEYEKRWPK